MLRRERISEQLKQKRLETSKPKGRPFKYPENKLKKEEMIRQLNELKELRELNTIEQEIIESNEAQPSDKKASQKKAPKKSKNEYGSLLGPLFLIRPHLGKIVLVKYRLNETFAKFTSIRSAMSRFSSI